jgi:hypothetical protein
VPLVLVPAALTKFKKECFFVIFLSAARRWYWYLQHKNCLIFWWYVGGTGTCSTKIVSYVGGIVFLCCMVQVTVPAGISTNFYLFEEIKQKTKNTPRCKIARSAQKHGTTRGTINSRVPAAHLHL